MPDRQPQEPVFDEAAFWSYVEEEYCQIEGTFDPESWPLETREQALTGELRLGKDKRKGESRFRSSKGDFIRFRDVDPDYDSRDYYYERGKALVPVLEAHIKRRKLTREFFRDFAEAKTCYGFIISHILDDGDTLGPMRASQKSAAARSHDADRKRLFVAWLLKRHHSRRVSAKEAVRKVAKEIAQHIESAQFSGRFPREWFASLIRISGDEVTLASSYQGNNLTKAEVERLTSLPCDDLPVLGWSAVTAERGDSSKRS